MADPAFVLIPSPLVGPRSLAPLAEALGNATVIAGEHPAQAPFWDAWAESVAAVPATAADIVLVPHSGAGPTAPLVAWRLIERGLSVSGIVYVDATLPGAYRSWLASYTDAAGELAAQAARNGGFVPNPWRKPSRWLAAGVPPVLASDAAEEARDLPLAWYAEPYPGHDAGLPWAFLAFEPNPFYGPMRDEAEAHGRPTLRLAGGHFHGMVAPAVVAAAIRQLARALTPRDEGSGQPN